MNERYFFPFFLSLQFFSGRERGKEDRVCEVFIYDAMSCAELACARGRALGEQIRMKEGEERREKKETGDLDEMSLLRVLIERHEEVGRSGVE